VLCSQIALDWGKSDIHFTGDASGNNGSALTSGSYGGNQIAKKHITTYVGKYYRHERVMFKKFNSNPDTALSGWIVSLFFNELQADFCIDASCEILISDLNKAEKLVGGKLNKDKANKGDYGHVMDCLRYLIHAFGLDIWEYLRQYYDLPEHFKNDLYNND